MNIPENLRSLIDPFGFHVDPNHENNLPETTVLWHTFLIFDNGTPLKLTPSFYANVWSEVWPHLKEHIKQKLSKDILNMCQSDKDLKSEPLEDWLIKVSKKISMFLGWSEEFFRNFPWTWISLDNCKLDQTAFRFRQYNHRKSKEWLKVLVEPGSVRPEIENLEQEFRLWINLYSKDGKFLNTRDAREKKEKLRKEFIGYDEETMTPQEKYITRTIKLEMEFYRTKEIDKLKALAVVHNMMKNLNEIKADDMTLKFRLGCEDDKNTQWLSILKFKGNVGEMAFAELFPIIYDQLPEEQKYFQGQQVLPRDFSFNYTSEGSKKSIKEIVEEASEEYNIPVNWPDVTPVYFPDFSAVNLTDEGALFINLFECTWSHCNSTKTANDTAKWQRFIKEFNEKNLSVRDNVTLEFKKPFIMLYVEPVNITKFKAEFEGLSQDVKCRINTVDILTSMYNQGVLAHDNPDFLQTVAFSKNLKLESDVTREYILDVPTMSRLEELVNADVEKDYGIKNYISKLEEVMTPEDVDKYEEELLNLLETKITDEFVKSQDKWVETTSERLHKGVERVKNNMFNISRIMRLVSNNHHDDNQFTMLNEFDDVMDIAESFFSRFSDMLESMNEIQIAKLKPTLCMAVCASAGMSTYLTTNMQFGFCEGLDNKTSKMSKLIRFLDSKFPNDARLEALKAYHKTKSSSHPVWKEGKYSMSEYKTRLDPQLLSLSNKKKRLDYIYRYTTATNSTIINTHNENVIKEQCCSEQVLRFDNNYNEAFIVCPLHKTRYRYPAPLRQLEIYIDQISSKTDKDNWSYEEVIEMLNNFLEDPEINHNVLVVGHVLHFLIGCTDKVKQIISNCNNHLHRCHPLHYNTILGTIGKKTLSDKGQSKISALGLNIKFRSENTSRYREEAKKIIDKWYVTNSKYLKDQISKDKLKAEFRELCETNPFSVCLADMAEKMILARSQHFTLSNATGYVTFSPVFGPIFSSGSDPNSESIKSFGLSEGHFYINHRTLRMIQGLPLMLVSNKLLVDKMAARKCEAGNYAKADLVKFCMLNSRRMNVNLQNIRYFFMACWSNIHSSKLYDKLNMDFLKTSELKMCLKIQKYMEEVLKNYDFLHQDEITNLAGTFLASDFPVLFNEDVRATLRHTDLCLHSFYMVHLFEKTIAGKVQEIKKVFEKFLKPKQAWIKDLNDFKKLSEVKEEELTLSQKELINRVLRSDGLLEGIKENFELCLDDMLKHKNKYSGFSLPFIKCAANRFKGFNLDRFDAELKRPHAIAELLKTTSTMSKFEPNVDFDRLCHAVYKKQEIQQVMKHTEKDMLAALHKIMMIPENNTFFPSCLKKLDNIKRKDASDISEQEACDLKVIIRSIKLNDISPTVICKLDEELSKTNFVQICENYNEEMHSKRNSPDDLAEVLNKYSSKFPNAFSLAEDTPDITLLLFCDEMRYTISEISDSVNKVQNDPEVISTDMRISLLIAAIKGYHKTITYCRNSIFSALHKERTPKNRRLKKQLEKSVSFYANSREMTTSIINKILTLMGDSKFSDTYSVCAKFKFNCDPVVFAMAFKEQFGGERELTIGDIWSKLTIKLSEDVAKDMGKCIRNSCLNAAENETTFKVSIMNKQETNKFSCDTKTEGESTPHQFWSIDRSKWGPFHQGLSFYTVMRILITNRNAKLDDVVDLVKYSLLKHGLKKFEIHHNVITSVVNKFLRKGTLVLNNGHWVVNTSIDKRKDIKIEDWEQFVMSQLQQGKKFIHTRMDMGQGMLHSCSDIYGAVIDEYIKYLTKKFFERSHGLDYSCESMNTSDDSAAVCQLRGEGASSSSNLLMIKEMIIRDVLQRHGNMYISEKSVGSKNVLEFKSSFVTNGEQERVLIKFVSTQLTIGKDCLPEDYWNSYNSLTKQVLCNGGSQMMCDLLYLGKLHLMQSVYSFSKTCFSDCILNAPPSRFGFPNLTCVDVYYHTSRFIMANRAINFLRSCGIDHDTIRLKKDDTKPYGPKNSLSIDLNSKAKLPFSFTVHNGSKFTTTAYENYYETEIMLHQATNSFKLKHTSLMNPSELENNLVKFFTLARSPGTKMTEAICCGVNTIIPSQRGKSKLIEGVEHKALRDMSYKDYFIMRSLPKTLESSKLRSAQALVQAESEQAKRAHQNMVFAKGKLINRGMFCILNSKLVDQKTAFNYFDCDDENFKSTVNLLKRMNEIYQPLKNAIKYVLKSNNDTRIDLRNPTRTHTEKDIQIHKDYEGRMNYDPILVRAYIRKKEISQNYSTEPLSEDDAFIDMHSRYSEDKMLEDVIQFKKYFSNFNDVELMLLTLGSEKKVLEGVYMFEESSDMVEQIGFVLQGCIHNHIQRDVTLGKIDLIDKSIDTVSILKLILMCTLYIHEHDNGDVIRNKLNRLVIQKPEIGAALAQGMSDKKYSYICSVIALFMNKDNVGAMKVLKDRFKYIKNFEETGNMNVRIWTGTCHGATFKCVQDMNDEIRLDLRVSQCNAFTQTKIKKTLKSVLDLHNCEFDLVVDTSMPTSAEYSETSSPEIVIDYRSKKFVICLANANKQYNVNFFSTCSSESDRVNKWNNCIKLTCSTPIITEVTQLWEIIKNDPFIHKKILSIDLSSFSLNVYNEQFGILNNLIEVSTTSNRTLRSCISMMPFEDQVVRDVITTNMDKFADIYPMGIAAQTTPFGVSLLQSKLIIESERREDLMLIDNFIKVLPQHSEKVTDLPLIKYNGQTLVHIGEVESGAFKGIRLMGFNYGLVPLSDLEKEVKESLGIKESKYFMVFNRETSVSKLFNLTRSDVDARIMLIDVNKGSIILSDLSYVSNYEVYDKLMKDHPSYRYCYITPTINREGIRKRIFLEF